MFFQKKNILIKDTTRKQREEIVNESLGITEGMCDGCASGLIDMYDDYIEGRKEISEINAEFRSGYVMGGDDDKETNCSGCISK